MRKILLIVTVLIGGVSSYAQLIPAPESLKFNKGHFVLDATTGIVFNGLELADSSKLTNYLTDKIEVETGVRMSSQKGQVKNVLFEVLKHPSKNLGDEGYLLNITTTEINIVANSYAGLFYGTQSLLQYIIANNTQTPIKLPNLSISDKPNVAWRGMTMDVSRHFFNANAIKELLDLLAFYKMNVFHWHLADNEGWRLEIKKYPKLTEVGAWRTEIPGSVFYKKDSTYTKKLDGPPYQYGGFYTQNQVKDIVAYAKD
ncbi:MAG: family 20 glycosylhydrolase, partial [Gelidibacter sp.]